MKRRIFLLAFLFLSLRITSLPSQDLTGFQLIAHYPLSKDSLDTTGNYPPMHLINTPFQDGGIYCNGIYIYGTQPGGSDAFTPKIDGLDFKKFAIQVKFKVPEARYQPIFVAGSFTRWIGIYMNFDSTLIGSYNNIIGLYGPDSIRYIPGQWHQVTVVYDSIRQTCEWYLDNKRIASHFFIIDHGNDKNISITDYGNGYTFKGIFADLRIYSGQVSTGVLSTEETVPARFFLFPAYPNPFNSETLIRFRLSSRVRVKLQIFDSLGREVALLADREFPAGTHSLSFVPSGLSGGVYFCRFTAGSYVQQRKIVYLP